MTRIPTGAVRAYRSQLRVLQAEQTRARILDATVRVMARGLTSVSIPAVAREAGVSVATIYRHFATKRDLLATLTARLSGYEVVYKLISLVGWGRLINRYSIAQNSDVIESGDFQEFARRLDSLEPKFMFEPIAQLAFQLGASDIHIEPAAESVERRHPVPEFT